MDLGLKNLRALVTGASRGLGYATALGLAREGVRLAINSRDAKTLNEAAERISSETKAEMHTLPGDLSKADLPAKVVERAASVLTVTSVSVKQPVPNLVLSNAGRAATVGLTKTLALELGPEGIRFNSILPSWTETQRIDQLMAQCAKDKGTTIEEEFAAQSAASPLGRMGQPEEFANAAVFLLSPAASYITGVMLTVDGGMYKGTL